MLAFISKMVFSTFSNTRLSYGFLSTGTMIKTVSNVFVHLTGLIETKHIFIGDL